MPLFIFDTLPPRRQSLILLQIQEFCHLNKIKMQWDILDMVTIALDLKKLKKNYPTHSHKKYKGGIWPR